MKNNIVIVGLPRVGKSTLLGKIIRDLPHKMGLITNEIRAQGNRIGFEMGPYCSILNTSIIAHRDFESQVIVSKYKVLPENMYHPVMFAKSELLNMNANDDSILYLDEVGEMQLCYSKFADLADSFLNAPFPCIITMSAVYDHAFIRQIRSRSDVVLVEITKENREQQEIFIKKLLKKMAKAKKYLSRDIQISIKGDEVEFHSEHGIRHMNLKHQTCDCEFFREYPECHTCSHLITAQEFFKDTYNAS